jgi:glutamyl-Q tRNA(Asp) synthetase
VFAAWTAWEAARRAAGGRFLVRLEDIDPQRCRAVFASAALEDLAWLGLHWSGSVRTQSEHLNEYSGVLSELRGRGLVYPCFCSRADVAREAAASAAAPHGPVGGPVYPGTCRRLTATERAGRLGAGVPHAWRLDMQQAMRAATGALRFHESRGGCIEANPSQFGDVVLGRRDAPASYHLCVTHDDALQGVTLVTRGEDLLAATHLHVLLQRLMGWPTPEYAHHSLARGADGNRLSKRDGAATVRDLRAAGAQPADVLRLSACALSADATP